MILLPFPAVTVPIDIAKHLGNQEKLDKARKKASKAVGVLISLDEGLRKAETMQKFLDEKCIPVVLECLSEYLGPRVLRDYIILMYFIQKVSLSNFIVYKNALMLFCVLISQILLVYNGR